MGKHVNLEEARKRAMAVLPEKVFRAIFMGSQDNTNSIKPEAFKMKQKYTKSAPKKKKKKKNAKKKKAQFCGSSSGKKKAGKGRPPIIDKRAAEQLHALIERLQSSKEGEDATISAERIRSAWKTPKKPKAYTLRRWLRANYSYGPPTLGRSLTPKKKLARKEFCQVGRQSCRQSLLSGFFICRATFVVVLSSVVGTVEHLSWYWGPCCAFVVRLV
jgi:hypothetical protein